MLRLKLACMAVLALWPAAAFAQRVPWETDRGILPDHGEATGAPKLTDGAIVIPPPKVTELPRGPYGNLSAEETREIQARIDGPFVPHDAAQFPLTPLPPPTPKSKGGWPGDPHRIEQLRTAIQLLAIVAAFAAMTLALNRRTKYTS